MYVMSIHIIECNRQRFSYASYAVITQIRLVKNRNRYTYFGHKMEIGSTAVDTSESGETFNILPLSLYCNRINFASKKDNANELK